MNKILSFLLLVSLTITLLVVPACASEETTEGTTAAITTTTSSAPPGATAPDQQELQRVLTKSLAATGNVSTYRFVINMGMKMGITGGKEAGTANITYIMGGDVSQVTREMSMLMDMALNVNVKSAAPSSQNMSLQMYLMADTLYMNVEMPPIGKQWIKTPITDEIKSAYNLNAVAQQLAPLELVKDLKFLRYETFDGSTCYVLSMTPDMQKIMAWAGKDLPGGLTDDSIGAISKIFKNLSYTLWIAKDTGFIKNLDVTLRMEMTPDQFNSDTSVDFTDLAMDITMNMKMFDYNKPITITLPPEAKNALEFPGQQ